MTNLMRTLTLLPLLVLGCTGDQRSALPAAPRDLVDALRAKAAHVCNEATAAALAARGVTAAEIASGFYIPVTSGDRAASRNTGWDAWISLIGQPGSVVIDHSLNCWVEQIYVRDGARLPR